MIVQHFWCRKIRKIVRRVPVEWIKSYFLCHDADVHVMSLADKCIVVGCFVFGDNDKTLMETGKFSDNIRVTENGRVSCWQSALFVAFYVLWRRQLTWSAPKECQLRRLLPLPTVWYTLPIHPWKRLCCDVWHAQTACQYICKLTIQKILRQGDNLTHSMIFFLFIFK